VASRRLYPRVKFGSPVTDVPHSTPVTRLASTAISRRRQLIARSSCPNKVPIGAWDVPAVPVMQRTTEDGGSTSAAPWGKSRVPGVMERFLRSLPDARRRDMLYLQSHWRFPRHRRPRALLEKINWRIVYDRREIISWSCDKLATKEFATRCPLVRVPATAWSGTNLAELLDVVMPERWVLKPNNASGLVYCGSGQVTQESLVHLRALTEGWDPPAVVTDLCEWGYANVPAVLLVEEMIDGPIPPIDFKFWVFNGEPRVVQVDVGRFSDHKMSFYSTDWEHLPVHSRKPRAAPIDRPPRLDQMLEAARFLSADMDFIRVDLYGVGDEVWFGELSPYPGSGLMKIAPARYNRAWGRWWALPEVAS